MEIIGLIASGLQAIGVPVQVAAFVAKAIPVVISLLIPTAGVYVAVYPIEYSIETEQIAILETTAATIYADNVKFDIIGGYCGITGNYNVRLQGVAGVDLQKASRFQNLFNTWYELPEPNLEHLYVEDFQIVSETTSLGCRVDYTEARDLAQYLAKLDFVNNDLVNTLLISSKESAIKTFTETFGVNAEDVNFYDDDSGNTSNIDLPVRYNCWGLNDGEEGKFVKIC